MIDLVKKSLLVLVLSFWGFTLCYADVTIRLANGEWTPFMSENLKFNGVVSRIVTEAFKLEGVKVEYKFLPWIIGLKEAQYGKIDGTLVWTQNPERERSFYFSDGVVDGVSVFFHLKNFNFEWETVDDLRGIRIGGTLGTSYVMLEKAKREGKLQIERVPSDEMNFKKILNKKIQIFQIDRAIGYNIINRNFTPEQVQLFTHHPKIIVKDTYRLMLSKKVRNNREMIELFNKGLKRLKETGKVVQYFMESRRGDYIIKK